ncbi:GNAT family N-acetyltransferase [Aestuariivivens sediminis]|uniref:GNAT family N-acetyltransferase n=1 Tax=Aestuariivivens sediminis TaxID=2913557 RepID=UPI001F58BFA5|nr:GNAT family protein [Aestuariivivens sediminis]
MKFSDYKIKPLENSDVDNFYTVMEKNRSRLENFFAGTVAKTKTLDATKKFVKDIEQKIKNDEYFPFVVIDINSNNIAGFIDVKNIDWNISKAELGLFMDYDYVGKGIATKAFQLIVAFCFDYYKFHKLFLRTHPSNMGAIAVAEKCGFKKEGYLRAEYKTTTGKVVDLLYYGLLKTDLKTLNNAVQH